MHTLVIDCATPACSVALFDDARLIAGDWRELGRGHAEALVPMIADLPGKGRADRIAVALGPGSFTGVRVGLAAAKALSLAWKVPLFGYATPDLIAAQAQGDRGALPVTVCMTGGHGEWFVQDFGADGAALGPVASLRPDQAAERAQAALVAGTEAANLVAKRGSGEALDLLPDARRFALLPSESSPPTPPLSTGAHPMRGCRSLPGERVRSRRPHHDRDA